jgi:hypothetical protein
MDVGGLRAVAGAILPRQRRWRRILASCDLDLADLPPTIDPPGPRDFIICGSPRSGTALATAMLFQPPRVVTVMEPWAGLRLPPAELFASFREEIASGVLRRGRLDVAALESERRVRWVRDGEVTHPIAASADHLLGIKWPAFWQYLGRLPTTKFVVCLRDPHEVVASYEQEGGRIAQGLDYDVPFNRQLNEELQAATDDPAVRRVLLYDRINQHVLRFLGDDNVFAIRYERWFDDRGRLVGELGDFLGAQLDPDRVEIRPPQSRRRAELPVPSRTAEALGY